MRRGAQSWLLAGVYFIFQHCVRGAVGQTHQPNSLNTTDTPSPQSMGTAEELEIIIGITALLLGILYVMHRCINRDHLKTESNFYERAASRRAVNKLAKQFIVLYEDEDGVHGADAELYLLAEGNRTPPRTVALAVESHHAPTTAVVALPVNPSGPQRGESVDSLDSFEHTTSFPVN